MRDLVLIDCQPARVRVFREAIAVYQERFKVLRERTAEARTEAARQVARARRSAEVIADFAAAKKGRRQDLDDGDGVRLHVFPSGAEAWKFLRREPPYEWAPRPAVVFTDLYLDGEGGLALVQRLKADPELCALPTVVLCASASDRHVRDAWEAGSNAVVSLPAEHPRMLTRVGETLEFWLTEAVV